MEKLLLHHCHSHQRNACWRCEMYACAQQINVLRHLWHMTSSLAKFQISRRSSPTCALRKNYHSLKTREKVHWAPKCVHLKIWNRPVTWQPVSRIRWGRTMWMCVSCFGRSFDANHILQMNVNHEGCWDNQVLGKLNQIVVHIDRSPESYQVRYYTNNAFATGWCGVPTHYRARRGPMIFLFLSGCWNLAESPATLRKPSGCNLWHNFWPWLCACMPVGCHCRVQGMKPTPWHNHLHINPCTS